MNDTCISDFERPSTGDTSVRLSHYRNKTVVLYFYPKDSTPGCTTEAQQFRDLHPDFLAAGCVVFGVSRDSLRAHDASRLGWIVRQAGGQLGLNARWQVQFDNVRTGHHPHGVTAVGDHEHLGRRRRRAEYGRHDDPRCEGRADGS